MIQWAKEIRDLLKAGVYVNNLRLIARAASRGLASRETALAAFVIHHVAVDVLETWEGRPLRAKEHKIVEDGLRPQLESVLDVLLEGLGRDDLVDACENLIAVWQSVQDELRDLAAVGER